jgi:hypothetical protein
MKNFKISRSRLLAHTHRTILIKHTTILWDNPIYVKYPLVFLQFMQKSSIAQFELKLQTTTKQAFLRPWWGSAKAFLTSNQMPPRSGRSSRLQLLWLRNTQKELRAICWPSPTSWCADYDFLVLIDSWALYRSVSSEMVCWVLWSLCLLKGGR